MPIYAVSVSLLRCNISHVFLSAESTRLFRYLDCICMALELIYEDCFKFGPLEKSFSDSMLPNSYPPNFLFCTFFSYFHKLVLVWDADFSD